MAKNWDALEGFLDGRVATVGECLETLEKARQLDSKQELVSLPPLLVMCNSANAFLRVSLCLCLCVCVLITVGTGLLCVTSCLVVGILFFVFGCLLEDERNVSNPGCAW